MSWFRVDDAFHSHPKVLALRGSRYRKGALALWALAGSWCAQQLTDGRIPVGVVQQLGGKSAEADTLVSVGLWVRTSDGYAFHDWEGRNPTRAQVETARGKNANRVKRWREKHATVGGAGNGAGNAVTDEVGNEVGNQVTERVTNLVRNASIDPIPSHPIPRERAHAPPLALVRAPTEENRPDGQKLSRSQFISVLIGGVRQAFESEGLAPPKQTRVLTWRGWDDIATWCDTQAALEGRSQIEVAQRLVRGFMIVEYRKRRGYPLPFLAENPGEYWEAAA